MKNIYSGGYGTLSMTGLTVGNYLIYTVTHTVQAQSGFTVIDTSGGMLVLTKVTSTTASITCASGEIYAIELAVE